ncbi:hypothetical protein BDZ45DRAFT_798240 [Acephala macrosclerotiorum]|nr:hypothetical protein BDZ45DRAFT_798240 [Acephala macrosclerotiorum]
MRSAASPTATGKVKYGFDFSVDTDAQFVDLWTQIATRYKSTTKVAFGVVNEPHEVDITKGAATVQLVVNAIRGAGATTQTILLPGNDYTSAGAFITNGSGAAPPHRKPDLRRAQVSR